MKDSITLKNKGNSAYVSHPLTPFLIEKNEFTFIITPKSKYWRFTFRFSKVENIDLIQSEFTKVNQNEFNYVDVSFCVGELVNKRWTYANRLQIKYSNNGQKQDLLKKYDHLTIERRPIRVTLNYDKKSQQLELSVRLQARAETLLKIDLPEDFKFFKIIASADLTEFELDCRLEVKRLSKFDNNDETKPFRVGRLVFRLGDMFDNEALELANVIVLPASSNGSITPNIFNRATELGIPYPEPQKPGTAKFYEVRDIATLFAGYGYSVDNGVSDYSIIENVCKSIITELRSKEISSATNVINIPILGTGAGNLNPRNVIDIYDNQFNSSNIYNVVVSVLSNELLNNIKNQFLGRYLTIEELASGQKQAIRDELLKEYGIKIDYNDFEINLMGQITRITLSELLPDFNKEFLTKLKYINSLRLKHCELSDYSFIQHFKDLHSLFINDCNIIDITFLQPLESLTTLEITNAAFTTPLVAQYIDLKVIGNLSRLKSLNLRGNYITSISFTKDLRDIENLDLSYNRIQSIEDISNFRKLYNLNLASNKIKDISPLVALEGLYLLDISNNLIENIEPIGRITNLIFLKGNNNPFTISNDLLLIENENHLPSLKNLLQQLTERNKIKIKLPAKVLLLGNHQSGKSSLLQYIQEEKIKPNHASTHIINIEKFPNSNTGIPDAIFYDFGGQDYYHGIYRAFLSGGSIYLILWTQATDHNQQRIDSTGVFTQDFTTNYWLSQKSYLENEKFSGEYNPTLLIQTHSDIHNKSSLAYKEGNIDVDNEFYISLHTSENEIKARSKEEVNVFSLKYLKSSILNLIETKRILIERPKWYKDFLDYILGENSKTAYKGLLVQENILLKYKRKDTNILDLLKLDLDQLHKQGLILYYKDQLPNIAWLNPKKLVQYIHREILNTKKIYRYKGRVPINKFTNVDGNILNLLCLQKVIYKHRYGNDGEEYIIPNYLPLVSESTDDFELHTFDLGNPKFTLKFKNFLPFGLINQLIFFFGKLPFKKKFWRDQILFKFNEHVKVLIQINFEKLEIKIYCSFYSSTFHEKNDVIKYLFFSALGLYWDMEILEYSDFKLYLNDKLKKEDFSPESESFKKIDNCERLFNREQCRPFDLYISINEEDFISYTDLCSADCLINIKSFKKNQDSKLINSPKVLSVYQFQPFTNRPLIKEKKAVISYSKKDLSLVDKFKQYLIPLNDDGLLQHPWYCTDLIAGEEWDEEIQRKFVEADIIFFMISENLMDTKYVLEHEIKNAIDRWENNKSVKIVPIILRPYHWKRKQPYDLSRFTALPYMARAVTEFPNESQAWHYISESIRIMLEYDVNPENINSAVQNELGRIRRDIVNRDLHVGEIS